MKNNAGIIRTTLLMVFFISGICALVYQIVWIKMLGQVFGLTIFAVSTVLTAYMAGLALGSYFFGKLIDKLKDHLLVFLFLELGIGVFALLFPLFLKLFTGVYVSLTMSDQPNLYVNSILRFIVSGVLLLIPTTLMGGTLPVLSKYYIKNLNQLGGNVGNLYSVNNFGAVAGCFLTGFFLIQLLGLSGSIYAAAILNLLIVGAIFIIRIKAPAAVNVPEEKKKPKTIRKSKAKIKRERLKNYPPSVLRLVLWVFAIEGFTTLSYEVIWTRILLGISTDRSVYFYSTVIIAFIFGLSLGSFIVARFVDKKKNLVFLLGAIEILIGIIACAVLIFFARISGYFHAARPHYTDPWLFSLGKEYFIFFLMMVVPTTLMGTTFPIVAKIYTTNIKSLGNKIGIIGCLDTIGSIFGSFAAGFILIPFIGVVKAVLLTAAINVILGIALILFNPHLKKKIKTLSIVLTIAAVITVVVLLPGENYFKYWQTEEKGDRLLFYKEGLGSTIAVPQKLEGVKELAIDGAVTAIAEYGDIRVHKLLAYLPYLFSEDPKKALVVGFGMGITTQSLVQEDMDEVTCVEINTEIIEGSSKFFAKENKKVLEEPKVNIVIEDGRSYMAMTRKKYDIITTNAVHQRLSINIYTKEFYQQCKTRLTDTGVMCQWIATNWISEYEYKMLLKSFLDVFPESTLWVSNIGHVLLVGTPGPLRINLEKFKNKLSEPKIRDDLKEVQLDDPYGFLALYAGSKKELKRYVEGIPPNSDNNPLPEFSRYISTTPNLNITDEIFTYPRDVESIITDWSDEDEKEKIKRYTGAEQYFLKARYIYFSNPASPLAAEYLEKAVELNPYNFSFRHTLGDKYSEMGRLVEATGEYKKEIELDDDNPLGYLNLTYAYLKLQKYSQALSTVRQAVNVDPENGMARYLLSVIHKINNNLEDALKELEFVTENFPGFTNAHFELGEIYFTVGQYKKAKASFSRYMKDAENKEEARQFLNELKKLGY